MYLLNVPLEALDINLLTEPEWVDRYRVISFTRSFIPVFRKMKRIKKMNDKNFED
jgi:hypothetical protein